LCSKEIIFSHIHVHAAKRELKCLIFISFENPGMIGQNSETSSVNYIKHCRITGNITNKYAYLTSIFEQIYNNIQSVLFKGRNNL